MIIALKNLLFTLVAPAMVGIYLPLILARNRTLVSALGFALAILLVAIGDSLYAWSVFDFAAFGRGSPFPLDAPQKLVRRSLYCYSRNPTYTIHTPRRCEGGIMPPSMASAARGMRRSIGLHRDADR